MTKAPAIIGLLLAAYFAGSIPFSLLLARAVAGIDIRQHGSGNVGATNVGRLLGWKWGIAALILDTLKGLLPTLLLPSLVRDPALGTHVAVGCGLAAIVGHMFPCWLGFRGGKGIATSLGVVLVLGPWGALAALGTFAILFATTRIVSLGSIAGVTAFAIVQLWLLRPDPFSGATWSLAAFSIAAPLLGIWRHRANIGRLLRGEEKAFATASKPAAVPM